ncbi:hypothetical protein GDO78_002999 [Eleutherodactylus coqui]|uniref:Uncharacterized protein n=1 Tax=Eleutherodactylus coqui TaxID=57060 RepID=A0A8J6K2A7_ELECQ|nr:hypothetical protein GDO78_002999 [Eleutherodactylus coqui]
MFVLYLHTSLLICGKNIPVPSIITFYAGVPIKLISLGVNTLKCLHGSQPSGSFEDLRANAYITRFFSNAITGTVHCLLYYIAVHVRYRYWGFLVTSAMHRAEYVMGPIITPCSNSLLLSDTCIVH